jgi:hypothetical protein
MKHLVSTLFLLAGVAGATGFVAYRATGDEHVAQALQKQDAMAWLRADFKLNDEQFAAIKKLHDSYSIVCEEHCRDIMRAVRARNQLKASGQPDAAALAAAERKVAELRAVCETAIASHVRECAKHMSPAAGERYLALVLPKIKDFDHQAAPDLQLNKHAH